jgi:hypothetical protein
VSKKHKEDCPAGILKGERAKCTCNEKPDIAEVAKKFGRYHKQKSDADDQLKKFRKMFFDLIEIPETQLARQTIFAEADDPDRYVETLYPKWRIVKAEQIGSDGELLEWKLIIEEDPAKKTFQYVNPLDKKVYQRTVVESAPDVDLERMKKDAPALYANVTFQPDPPPRELRPLGSFDEDELEGIRRFLLPPKLTERMESPRKAKPEELEGLE